MLPVLDVVPMRELDTVAAGTAVIGVVDTKGYDYAKLLYITSKSTGVSAQDFLDLAESDTIPTAFADGTAVEGFDGTADYSIVAESTTFSNVYVFNVDLKGRKRYLVTNYESDMTHYGCWVALLGRKADGDEETVATTAHGARNIVNG